MVDLTKPQDLLNHGLYRFPILFKDRWNDTATWELQQLLFNSLAAQRQDYLRLLFPHGIPANTSQPWSLRDAQGAVDGAEYLESARGTACGHIFKSGESTYACRTCAADDTCVLCTKCFESSEHEGHQVYISISPGNSGCCDCGDKEAWKREVICSIHSEHSVHNTGKAKDKQEINTSNLPPILADAIRKTIARAIDYICDVFSCSPEQMRMAKTESSIRQEERNSRLSSKVYGATEDDVDDQPDFALVLWNDEKHTVTDVTEVVARACRKRKSFGRSKAMEIDEVGRSVIHYSKDVADLLQMAVIIEQLKLTVTIRSARDTFREQMCAVIIDWIADISGCAVGNNAAFLRNVICEEMLQPWRIGSEAGNKDIATQGIYDNEAEEMDMEMSRASQNARFFRPRPEPDRADNALNEADEDEDEDISHDDRDFEDDDDDDMEVDMDELQDVINAAAGNMEIEFLDDDNDVTEVMEAALAGYPAPPPPPRPAPAARARILTPTDSEDGDADSIRPIVEAPFGQVPKTPQVRSVHRRPARPSRHWLEKPEAFKSVQTKIPCEDLWQRVRLDWLILYDLRLWKTLRVNLRHLYISTVVVIPQFKRILALRFAGLYTPLAELYLVADREPDHSIIHLSVQMLTTPTITEEVVERGNFLTNLMAILYTFLTTRQVGYPDEVNPRAVLAFDAGTVTNRRIFHFFLDLRWLCQSEYTQWRMKSEPRYLLQFLDLVKLHQGICPNVRATGDHVEYESDAWISASLVIKEVDKLCRQVALAFKPDGMQNTNVQLERAIRTVAQVAMINSFGYERKRFNQSELKSVLDFHTIGPFAEHTGSYKVPKHIIQSEPMSFHHPLHYLLSWLIEHGKAMSRGALRSLLRFTAADLKDPYNAVRNAPTPPSNLTSDQMLSAVLDPPLRVCAWLAQCKAGMWVRNGMTLRHQASSYRSVTNRDIGYQRDILLVQAGLVLLEGQDRQPGETFLAQIIDRFQMVDWMKCDYSVVAGFEESQQLDVVEDLYHLLVIALSERGHLMVEQDSDSDHVLEHDIAHALCFKPIGFTELSSKVTEKVSESDHFSIILERMATFKPPEALHDIGTFELKPEYIDLIDPYYAHYTRNLREEAESVHRKHMARKTGQKPENIVYEPRLQAIESGVFHDLAAFTRTHLFDQIIFAALEYVSGSYSKIQSTRLETFLHMVLHLIQIALHEDQPSPQSFSDLITTETTRPAIGRKTSVVHTLLGLSEMGEYASCHATIKHILSKITRLQPEKMAGVVGSSARFLDRATNGSPASLSAEDKEKKKQENLARQAKVMAEMKKQQNSFLMNAGLEGYDDDNDDDLNDDDTMSITNDTNNTTKKHWHFPTGTCILCQEATNDQKLYGTFAYLGESNILRTTPDDDADYMLEVLQTPENLDQEYEARPFGVSGNNKITISRTSADGVVTQTEQQVLSKGFLQDVNSTNGPVSTSCGHIMHYSCFEAYFAATVRRHQQQIARSQPEAYKQKEFICPLCKAVGNTFLPIVWKSKVCASDNDLYTTESLSSWLGRGGDMVQHAAVRQRELYQRFRTYMADTFMPSLITSMGEMSVNASHIPRPARRSFSLSSLIHRQSESDIIIPARRTPTTLGAIEGSNHIVDLEQAYSRAGETVLVNDLAPESSSADQVAATIATLARALGMSISAIEIANRGMPSTTGNVLNDLNEQAVVHLRILSETFESYYCVEARSPESTADIKLLEKQDLLRDVLFQTMIPRRNLLGMECLQEDMFLFFNDWLAYMDPSLSEGLSVLQLCLWAEIVKVVLLFKDSKLDTTCNAVLSDEFIGSCQEINRLAETTLPEDENYTHTDLEHSKMQIIRSAINPYATTFLRKCLMLLYIKYGFEFKQDELVGSELTRLTKRLNILSIDGLFTLYASATAVGERMRSMTREWITRASTDSWSGPLIAISHPTIFELLGLPKNYDTLTEEAIKRRCPTTGKELTNPACCLFCGDIFCSQAVCCMKDGHHGGCWQHMQKCSNGKVGLFINIRKCMVLFMSGDRGAFTAAPYLDRHGEPDPTLRRHHQLFLHQKRYDKLLRDTWLQHGIQNYISRKLEADINPGGWETL